ncbi:MAG: hypothetical protein ACREPZ_14010 [Rhodanobacteraceae bacterium]
MAVACMLALVLAACHHAPPPPSNVTPEKAVATNLRLTAAGDFDNLMRNRLSSADYATWRSEWDKAHAHPVPASVAQQEQFAKIMQMLTEPGAEAKLAKRLQPELARMRGGKGKTMPILGGIVEAAGKQMIANSPQLGSAQRTLVTQALDASIGWAKSTDFSDPGKAKKAIGLVCATARQLHVETLAQWRALDYAGTMERYGVIWRALEKLLDIYGLDLAKVLNEASVQAVGHDGNRATIEVKLTLADKPLSAEWPMVKQEGHWYDEAMLEAWRKAHPAPASSGSSAPAAAGSSIAPTGAPSATSVIPPAASRS